MVYLPKKKDKMNIKYETEFPTNEIVWIVKKDIDNEGNKTYYPIGDIISEIQLVVSCDTKTPIDECYHLMYECDLYRSENVVRSWYNQECLSLSNNGKEQEKSFYDWLENEKHIIPYIIYPTKEKADEVAEHLNQLARKKD